MSKKVFSTELDGGIEEELSKKKGKKRQSISDKEEHSGSSSGKKVKNTARDAFTSGDGPLSVMIHDKAKDTSAKEKHKKGGDYLKSIIYGGLDGIITIFSVIAGAAGADLGGEIVLIMGISSLLADAISMGVGDYISDKAEIEYAKAEQKREEWEYENYPEGEIDEMIQIYQKKGLNLNESKELVTILSNNKKNFIDTMMVEELGIIPPDPDDNPFKNGLVTFASFIFFGIIPMIPFIVGVAINAPFMNLFIAACIMTALTQFFLGAITSRFTIISWWKGGFYMLLVGVVASGVSYLTAWIVIMIVGKESMCAA